MEKVVNYYSVLRIRNDSSSQEIKAAYRRLAKVWHPDKNNKPEAHEKFIQIEEAYSILKDEHKRIVYDDLLRSYQVDIARKYENKSSFNSTESSFKQNEDYFRYKDWVKQSKANSMIIISMYLEKGFINSFHFLDKYGCLIIIISVILISSLLYFIN